MRTGGITATATCVSAPGRKPVAEDDDPSNNGQSVRRYGWRDARFGVRRQKIRSAKSRAEDKPDVGCPTVPGSARRHEDVERRASLDSYGSSRRRSRRPRKARLQLIQIIFAAERRPCKMWIDTRDEL